MQAVPLSARKTTGGSPEGIAPFLQLPHISEAVVKKVARKVRQNAIHMVNYPCSKRPCSCYLFCSYTV
jgi:translocation protein SEC63